MAKHLTVSGQLIAMLLLGLQVISATAADKKTWEKFVDCRYVPKEYNDGDSFRVFCGGREFVVRLYYVDAPESRLINGERVREQREYFNVTIDDVLTLGTQATERVRNILGKPFIIHTRWAGAAGRSSAPRYYALVEVDGRSLIEILLADGLARVKGVAVNLPSGEKSTNYLKRLKSLEQKARIEKKGAWGRQVIRR